MSKFSSVPSSPSRRKHPTFIQNCTHELPGQRFPVRTRTSSSRSVIISTQKTPGILPSSECATQMSSTTPPPPPLCPHLDTLRASNSAPPCVGNKQTSQCICAGWRPRGRGSAQPVGRPTRDGQVLRLARRPTIIGL